MNHTATDTGDGAIIPTWTAVDNNNVRTQRELMEYMRAEGWNVEVCALGPRCFACVLVLTCSHRLVPPVRDAPHSSTPV